VNSMGEGTASVRDYFMVSERLGFATWQEDDARLAAAIWGDPEVTRLTGGPFTSQQVGERLAAEIANLRRHGLQYWPIFRLGTASLSDVVAFGLGSGPIDPSGMSVVETFGTDRGLD